MQTEMQIIDIENKPYEATIAVAKIAPPAGAVKSYTLTTYDGNELSLWPDKIGLIRTGQRYAVEVTDKEVRGKVYHRIGGTPKCLGAYQPAEEQLKPPPKPQPQTNGKKMDYWTPKPRDPADLKQIWCNALLGREIEKCPVLMTKEELLSRAEIHADVWDQIFGSVSVARE
jgi:hypothetical protein